ncbi:MAG TPA: polysaccharide deacetylase family protein [Gemmatimonadaceae bacterium]|nr:polysaccharide deacetylase family protein [Gemmatimonadaceae bacterium]
MSDMMKRRVKSILGAIAYRTGAYRWFFRRRAVVVLFHRVDDALGGNPISCTSQEFRDYCAFFRRHFTVVGLGELLERLRRGEDVGGHLVITFDDGYKDNHDVAAPELRRQGLPACFFIATEFIGSRRVPWWDAERSIQSRWMSWDEVRALRAQGFEIGAHTLNHVDLGKVVGDEARHEIRESGARLERELGAEIPFFSYPYGRIDQITEENREEVRAAGYRCCVSAYGGTVGPGVDPFRMKREPISPWFISPYHLGFELLFRET